ncbi:hypothetical protein Aph01nite_32080 [Acrocarpospora phusangensis]|uniref:Membrane protein YmcC n=1 Tax=Acrocarpospora phusangensis TaxID=1070424 RepID=A0A919QCI2_9ACTN|nr:hypothetical protein [Acrocarpospora phusangensis]GIH24898.1 hypothetical protein Aph01nite_32080 [Acrocarpospora phusangensis]
MLGLIIACEVGFWVFLGLGLLARYGLRLKRVSAVLLLCVPLIDVVLLVAAVIDMRSGAVATWQHGLAAAYLGYSVVFGHRTVRWVDEHVAHRFAGGPAPWKPPSGGSARTRYEWGFWLKIVLAYGISCVLLLGAIVMVGDSSRTEALADFMLAALRIPVIAALWPITYTLWPKKEVTTG